MPNQLQALPREALVKIALAAITALSRYKDHEGEPGFPPGECAWAMARDLRGGAGSPRRGGGELWGSGEAQCFGMSAG